MQKENNSNVIVKQIEPEDFSDYLKLSKRFHDNAPIKNHVAFDENSALAFLNFAVNNPNMILLCCKENDKMVGITGGLYFPLYFNQNYNIVQELCWWVEKDYRGSSCGKLMYEALENWAKEKKANGMFMIALEDENVETMSKLYERKGFVGTERIFIKEL